MEKFASSSTLQTIDIAKSIAKKIPKGSVVVLNGDMGVGKTVFAKGFALGLGINQTVVSPTFAIMNIYEGDCFLYHYDMYRITHPTEALELGLIEYFGKQDGICLVEWAQNISEYLPKEVVSVDIVAVGEYEREITISL